MTDRERWIVYPLVFLSLGISLRDKLTRTIDNVDLIEGKTRLGEEVVQCGALRVVNGQGQPTFVLDSEGKLRLPAQVVIPRLVPLSPPSAPPPDTQRTPHIKPPAENTPGPPEPAE